ncbi:MAG: glycosyl transferase [Actinomycetota bacterium]
MGDYFQNGVITTLHDLSGHPQTHLEEDLATWSNDQPISLVIPALYSEFEGPAMPRIISELEKISYLNEVIIGLDNADAEQFKLVRKHCRNLEPHCRVIWNDGPGMTEIRKDLMSQGLALGERGKGSNVWFAMGYFLASKRGKILALHDADILNYRAGMLTRLLYPLANPSFNYEFCKGYYFRADSTGFYGRVSRLLVAPLLKALRHEMGANEFVDYLDSFRYPLAGEFSLHARIVQDLHIPSDWGLEIGVLADVFEALSPSQVCQVDIANSYNHKHQDVSEDDPSKGLHRMATDISKLIFAKLSAETDQMSPAFFNNLTRTYNALATNLVEKYSHNAEMNGYPLDEQQELLLVELFSKIIGKTGEERVSTPKEPPLIPSWSVVNSNMPEISKRLKETVDLENQR